MLVYGAASAAIAFLIQIILDDVLPHRQRLGTVAIAIIGIYVCKGLGAFVSAYLMTDVGQRVVRDIRNRLFTHILGQSAGIFSRRSTGALMSRITNDVGQIQQAVSE